MKKLFARRGFLLRMTAFFTLPWLNLRASHAQNTPSIQSESADAVIKRITGGAAVQEGRVKLEIPVLADNGNSVSLRVIVDSPMTVANHVKSIHLIAPKNPRPAVASFFYGAGAGRPQLSTRIRLSGSQGVMAIAAMSDGSYWSATAEVAVTVSACWDAS
jgi:sulfur-oxidizing protein SoxY